MADAVNGLMVDGATRIIPIIGDPIAQVKSPTGMSAALQGMGRNVMVVPIHVTPADFAVVMAGLAASKNIDGIIVTVPHKFACYTACATATTRGHALEAVNTMRRNADGTWHGEMFDGVGYVTAIRANGGTTEGKRALLVGAGGAGTAIGQALLEAGVAALAVHDADTVRRDALIARLNRFFPGQVSAGSPDPRGFDIIANASPAGMRESDPLPVDVSGLSPEMFAACVITAPAVSPFVQAARAIGCKSSVGADMYRAVQAKMLAFLTEAP